MRLATRSIILACCVAALLVISIHAARSAPFTSKPAAATTRCDDQHPLNCRRAVAYWRTRALEALTAVHWQRQEVARSKAAHWPGDAAAALLLACHTEGLSDAQCGPFFVVARCESHLNPLAVNGQYKSMFQLSPRHRDDPIIQLLGWQNPYAASLHTVKYVLAHGFSEWQCEPSGGLRW